MSDIVLGQKILISFFLFIFFNEDGRQVFDLG